jgi:hypothetical protein
MKLPIFALAVMMVVAPGLRAEEIDTRAAIGISSGRSVDAALKRAATDNKLVLVIAADPDKKSQTFHVKGMMEFEETKKLVKEHFILVSTDLKEKHVRSMLGDLSTERPVYFLLDKDGKTIAKGTTAVGGKAGNDLVKGWTAKR